MLKLIALSKKRMNELSSEMDKEENRKKSCNMVLGSHIVQDLLAQTKQHAFESFDFVFCTGEGEIYQTFEFYKFLAQNRPRPILFQNSLHNSTLGALSFEVPHLASGVTISNGDLSFEGGIDYALSSPSALPVIILGIDVYNEEIGRVRAGQYGNAIELISAGAGGIFLPENHPLFPTLPGPVIKDIKFSATNDQVREKEYYPANGLEKMSFNQTHQTYLRPNGYKVDLFLC